MGQRANLIVKRHGVWRLYYDHWCANRLDVELFWGPEPARLFIERFDPVCDSRWLDEVWCEGAAVLDLDDRILLFFGGEDIMGNVPLRRAHLSLMQETWRGWQIRWAHEGIVSVGTYVGEPAARFLSDHEPDPEQRFRVDRDRSGANGILVTDTRDGVTSVRRVAGDEGSLRLGPGALEVLREVQGQHGLKWQGEMPAGGLHVDFDAKALAFWWAHPTAAIVDRAAAAWPGWDVSWFKDRFEAQIEQAGLDIRLPETPLIDLQTARIERLRDCCHWPARNPARDLAARIGAATIGPATDEARGSVGNESEKQKLLAEFSGRLPGRRN